MTEASPPIPEFPTGTLRERDLTDALMQIARSLVVLTDRAGHVVRCNALAAQFLGLPPQQVVGRTVASLLPDDAADAARAFFEHLDRTPPRSSTTIVMRRHDGERRFISWTNVPLEDPTGHTAFVLSSGVDVTVSPATPGEVRFDADLLDLVDDAVTILEPDGRVRSLNAAARRLYGQSDEEVRGQVLDERLRASGDLSPEEARVAVLRHDRWTGTMTYRTPEGDRVTVQSRRVLRRDPSGAPSFVVQVDRDLRRGEDEAREALVERLTEERARLDAVVRGLPMGLLVIDTTTSRVSVTNPSFERLLGHEVQPGATVTRTLSAVTTVDGRPATHVLVEDVLRSPGGVTHAELRVERPDRSILRVTASAAPVHDRLDRIVAIVVTLREATLRAPTPSASLPASSMSTEFFGRRFGRALGTLGHPPLEGRLVALLLLSPTPVSLSNAARTLGATKGALSKVVHDLLARHDLIVTRAPSTREHHLSLPGGTFLRDLHQQRELSLSIATLTYAMLRDNADLDPDVTDRARAFADLRAAHAGALDGLLAEPAEVQRREVGAHLAQNWDAVVPRPDDD
ncbi:PAS domain-containing protein [Deinococcus pimensis]|uniref:PAS domain-containing protein n=1 Tax=Deinococcus pimensis TaxID=309888 RepID=UPI00047FC959|nr:PAS domain-containing protein [Deinococcus pimensis]